MGVMKRWYLEEEERKQWVDWACSSARDGEMIPVTEQLFSALFRWQLSRAGQLRTGKELSSEERELFDAVEEWCRANIEFEDDVGVVD